MSETRLECFINVKDVFGFLDDATIKDVESNLEQIIIDNGGDNSATNIAITRYLEEVEKTLKHASTAKIRNALKTNALTNHILMKGETFNEAEAFKRFRDIYTGPNSVESNTINFRSLYESILANGLKSEGAEKAMLAGTFDKELRIAAFHLNKKGGKIPANTSPEIVKALGVLEKVQNRLLSDAKALGLNIRKLGGRLGRRRYSGEKMWGKEDEVITDLFKDVNIRETFGKDISPDEVRAIFKEMYEHMTDKDIASGIDDSIKPPNYSKLMKSREIVFRSGEHEHNFMSKWGHGETIYEGIVQELSSVSKAYANMKILGDSPNVTTAQMMKSYEKHLKETGMASNKVEKSLAAIRRRYENTSGNKDHTPEGILVDIANAIKATQTFKLGASMFTSMYDLNSTAFHFHVNSSMGILQSYAHSVKSFVEAAKLSDADKFRLAEQAALQLEFIDPTIVMGMHAKDFSGRFSRYNKFVGGLYKFSGVPFQVKLARMQNAAMYSRHMADMADIGWDKLHARELHSLQKFGFTEKDMSTLARVKKNDMGMLTQQQVTDLPRGFFDPRTKVDARMKAELAQKISNYVNHMTIKGTPTPGVEAKIALGKDASRDEFTRAMMGVVMQFKETPLKILHDMKGGFEDLHATGGAKGVGAAVGGYLATGFASYVAIESMRRLILNQESLFDQVDDLDPKVLRSMFFDYVNKISIAPILSDGVEALASPYENATMRWALGPSFSTLTDLGKAARPNLSSRARRKRVGNALGNILPTSWFLGKGAWRHSMKYNWLSGQHLKKKMHEAVELDK